MRKDCDAPLSFLKSSAITTHPEHKKTSLFWCPVLMAPEGRCFPIDGVYFNRERI
jgi:hypothetical protein